MTAVLTYATLMTKAARACVSARALLDLDDVDGACSRAYYAMFDGARAALLAASAPVETQSIRTHAGLIAAFGLHLVKAGLVPRDLGRLLNRAQEVRQVADYSPTSVAAGLAREVVDHADAFLAAIRDRFGTA